MDDDYSLEMCTPPAPVDDPEWDAGQVAYDAYREFSRGVSLISGAQLPEWEAQAESIKDAWRHAAYALKVKFGAIY